MTATRSLLVPLGLLAALPLGGCGDSSLARSFGMVRDAPDEFRVTTQAPLSMPPDFALRPPRPGAARPQQLSERQQAEEILVPQLALTGGSGAGGASRGQSALLADSGPAAQGDVRAQVDRDSRVEQASDGFLTRLLGHDRAAARATEVDAERENQRLRQAAALGQSAPQGPTPTIKAKDEGWFRRLINWF
jgi:hypothetical protein